MSNSPSNAVASSWDTYWRGTSDGAAFSSGGVSHPTIHAFWHAFLKESFVAQPTAKWLDLATGNGALVEIAATTLADLPSDITCVDISDAAIRNVKERFPSISGLVADAREIPLTEMSFDLVTSQFGIEYAGVDAIDEAARLTAAGGSMALLMHRPDSVVHHECLASLDAIRRLKDANFIPLASELFRCGFEAVKGADRAPYENAAAAFNDALRVAEDVMTEHGEGVAGDTVVRLYADIERIHSAMPKYESFDVMTWLATMDEQLDSYRERMASMINAAVSNDDFAAATARLKKAGFAITKADTLSTDDGQALAWLLITRRSS